MNELAEALTALGIDWANMSPPLQIALILGVLPLIPMAIFTTTAFTRCVIVLAFVRQALATQNVPPNLVLVGLALFLTLYIMRPVISDIDKQCIQPYLAKNITLNQALNSAWIIHKRFMLSHTRKNDISLFMKFANITEIDSPENTPAHVLLPAFLISELKTGFIMGFCIYLPFLMIDLVVSSILTSIGMVMMPPIIISAPFKLLLFVLADGWHIIAYVLTASFQI